MNKTSLPSSYTSPECEVLEIRLEQTFLSGGDLFGNPGEPGSLLDINDPLLF